jgi:hypothetical protein
MHPPCLYHKNDDKTRRVEVEAVEVFFNNLGKHGKNYALVGLNGIG